MTLYYTPNFWQEHCPFLTTFLRNYLIFAYDLLSKSSLKHDWTNFRDVLGPGSGMSALACSCITVLLAKLANFEVKPV